MTVRVRAAFEEPLQDPDAAFTLLARAARWQEHDRRGDHNSETFAHLLHTITLYPGVEL
jgi:hypothetical protein